MTAPVSDNLRGSLLMVLSMAGFAVEDMAVKAAARHMPMGEVVVLYGLIGLAFFASLAVLRGEPPLPRAFVNRTMLIRSVFEVAGRLFHALALALIPLVILWFGIDETAKLFLVSLGVFFPIYLNTLHGIRTVDPQLIEMGRIYGMTDGELFRRVIFPGALPSIFVGVRFALGIMWLTLIVAETIAASSGLGYMAMQAREFLMIDVVVLSILIYALLGKLADSLARLLESQTLAWHPAFQTA